MFTAIKNTLIGKSKYILLNIDISTMKSIDFDLFDEYFEYSEDSPSFLIWAKAPGTRVKVGACAGSISNKGYYRVKINSIPYQAHRVIWVLFYGSIPENMVINHIDGNTLNNNISNLEICTQAENNRRQKQHTQGILTKTNTTGIRGLSFANMGKNTYVAINLVIDGVKYSKNFKYTDNKTKELALFDAMTLLEELGVQYIYSE